MPSQAPQRAAAGNTHNRATQGQQEERNAAGQKGQATTVKTPKFIELYKYHGAPRISLLYTADDSNAVVTSTQSQLAVSQLWLGYMLEQTGKTGGEQQ